MNKLYISGNYVIYVYNDIVTPLSRKDVKYDITNEDYEVFVPLGERRRILKSEIGTFDTSEDGGTKYTEETLIVFLNDNTGCYNCENAGVLWGDITGNIFDNDALITLVGSVKLDNRIIVNQANLALTLGGVIDSTKEYFIDGIIDTEGVEITVPPTGIEIRGFSFDTSKLICSEDNYTMFKSDVGNSGNILFTDFSIEVTGLSSKVYNIIDATGFSCFECNRVNYNNCTSLGEISEYRQGLELGTGRFGGTPQLILSGEWLGGFRVSTSIARSLTDGSYSLFKTGTGLLINSRFIIDVNCDIPASASFCDFSPANFPNPSSLQIINALFTREGVSDPNDTGIFPNISSTSVKSVFRDCQGVKNTFEGGQLTITNEAQTIITSSGTFYTIAGTWTASDLQHFENPANGQLRHLGNSPREYQVNADLIVDGPQNAEVEIRLRVFDSNSVTFSTVFSQRRQVNSLIGQRDVAMFNIHTKTELGINDYAFLEISNNSNQGNLTVELDSYFDLEKR